MFIEKFHNVKNILKYLGFKKPCVTLRFCEVFCKNMQVISYHEQDFKVSWHHFTMIQNQKVSTSGPTTIPVTPAMPRDSSSQETRPELTNRFDLLYYYCYWSTEIGGPFQCFLLWDSNFGVVPLVSAGLTFMLVISWNLWWFFANNKGWLSWDGCVLIYMFHYKFGLHKYFQVLSCSKVVAQSCIPCIHNSVFSYGAFQGIAVYDRSKLNIDI